MSATTTDGAYAVTELRRMDETTARSELTVNEYERWESVNKHLDDAEEVRQEWADNEREATDILVNSDVSDLAVELRLFGNDCLVYYGPEDARLRDAVDNLGDVLGVDLVGADDLNISDDDISDDDVGEIKDVLVEMVSVALIEWNGHDWADLPVGERERVLSSIRTPRPDGWGLAGLMDAWTDIQVAVEENRNERLERVRKFRNPERRGDRRNPATDGL